MSIIFKHKLLGLRISSVRFNNMKLYWRPLVVISLAGVVAVIAFWGSSTATQTKVLPLPAVAGVQIVQAPEVSTIGDDKSLGAGLAINGLSSIYGVPKVLSSAPLRVVVGVHNLGIGDLTDVKAVDNASGVSLKCKDPSVLSAGATTCYLDGTANLLNTGIWSSSITVTAVAEDTKMREVIVFYSLDIV
jgi:hypothetical protein